MQKAIQHFADTTSMHGVPRVINATNVMSRTFWSVVCLGAAGMFLLQVSYIFVRYYSFPKKVTIEVTPAQVPFPSISVCNMRNLDVYILDTLNKMFLESDQPLDHIDKSRNRFINSYMNLVAKFGPLFYKYQKEYPEIFQEIFSRTTFSANIPKEIIQEAGETLSGFVVTCMYANHMCDSDHFTRFFDPYYYNCFTYKAPKLVTGDFGNEKGESLAEGIENGWSAIFLAGSGMLAKNKEIRMLPGLSEWQSPVSASEGIRVVIHPPGTIPYPFTEGYDIPPGFSASLGIKPVKNIRIGLPHGNCSVSDPFGGGQSCENGGTVYRLMSCQKMCLQMEIMKSCGCADVSLPLLPDTKPSLCRHNDKLSDSCMTEASPKCLQDMLDTYERITCLHKTRRRIIEEGGIVEKCDCFAPCEDVAYDVSYSLSKWPASGYEGDASFVGIFNITKFNDRFNKPETMGKYKLFKAYFNESNSARREESLKNFARLNVYIADANVVKTEESEDYTGSDVISDIGGQLGLWVGISVITLAEVIALIGDILTYLFGKCHKKTTQGYFNNNIENSNKRDDPDHYARVSANENTEDEDDPIYKGDNNVRNRPMYAGTQPKTSKVPIHARMPSNDQWTSKFVDYNSKNPSLPGGINLSKEYSEV